MTRDLAVVRETPVRQWAAFAVATAVGLTLASVHPLGLLAGGALVSLPAQNWQRGLLAGVAFGLLAWLAFAGSLAVHGNLERYLAMGRILAVSAAIPLVLGTAGGLARALLPE